MTPGISCRVAPEDKPRSATVVKTVDACGLQCPGPIMQVAQALDGIKEGEAITVLASDPAFTSDVGAWCHSTGNRLIEVAPENGHYKATIAKGRASSQAGCSSAETRKNKTIVVFSSDFDKMVAAFIIANGAAAMGSEVTMFFTFWGLNALRRPKRVAGRKEPDREDVRLDDAPRRRKAQALSDEYGRNGPGDDQGHYEEEERGRRCRN